MMWAPLQTLVETIHRRVCPLYTFDEARRVQVVGSAIPFNSNGFRFLITATHVGVKQPQQASVPLFTMGHEAPLFLSGRRIAWEYKRGVTPDLDIALIELTDDEAHDLEREYQFTTPNDTATTKPKTPGVHYLIAGYPAARNRFISPKYYPSAMATYLITGDIQDVGDEMKLLDKRSEDHFVLSLPYEQVPKMGGRNYRIPKASGMSGGGIWRLDIDIPRQLASTPLLVGIGIEHHRAKGLFVATRIQAAIPLLKDLMGFVAEGIWPEPRDS